mgnify:CR=1 FL=1
MATHAAEVNEPVNGSQKVIGRDVIINRELVEQRSLRYLSWPHHRPHSLASGK